MLTSKAYSPVLERHSHKKVTTGDYVALRDITAREKIFTNYLDYFDDPDWWGHDELAARGLCYEKLSGNMVH